MRFVGFVLVLALGAGCKGKGDAEAAPDPAALKAQQELLARRDKLLEQRQELQEKRAKVDAEIQQIVQAGGDPTAKNKEKADLEKELDSSVGNELQQLNTKLDTIKTSGDHSAQIATREAEVANREAQVAARERSIAEREKSLIQRDSDLAQRWKDSCASAAVAPVIIQQPAGKGGNYSKKEVSDLIARARAAMAKKGILNADLPGPAQTLEDTAAHALADNNNDKAYFAASQLVGMVDTINVNRAFIQAKMIRVQNQIKGGKQDDATTQQLSNVLKEVIQNFGDGDFNAANKRLNSLVAQLK